MGLVTKPVESRHAGSFVDHYLADRRTGVVGGSAASVSMSPETALGLSAVHAAVKVISESVAGLPLVLYRNLPDGAKERAREHPIYRMLHDQPNAEQTSFEFRETMQMALCLHGNAYARKIVDNGGRVRELHSINPHRVELKFQGESKELIYIIRGGDGNPAFALSRGEVLHVRALATDGYLGYSPITLARVSVQMGLSAESYGANFFANDARPGGLLEHPGRLSEDAYKRLKSSWEESHRGPGAAHRMDILEEGLKWSPVTISNSDAQFLESRRFQIEEIARIFRIPPHFLASLDKATFANIESQSRDFMQNSIDPWLNRWKQALRRDLLLASEWDGFSIDFIREGALRGDTVTRFNAYATGRNWGWLSSNDIRKMENLNPIEDGDEYLVPLNMAPAGALPVTVPGAPAPSNGTQDPASEPRDTEAAGFDEEQAITSSSVLNGAQVTAIVDLMSQVATGIQSRQNVIALMGIAFGIDAEKAGSILPAEGSVKIPEATPSTDARAQVLPGKISRASERETRALDKRWAIKEAMKPVFQEVAGRITNIEIREIRKGLKKRSVRASPDEMSSFLERFYAEFAGDVERFSRSAFASMSELIGPEAVREVGSAALAVDGKRLAEYADFLATGFAKRHTEASLGQLSKLAISELDAPKAIEKRLEEWALTRPAKIANRETVQSANAIAKMIYKQGGVRRLKWKTRGENCPFCDSLSNRVVEIEKTFASSGEEIFAEGRPPLLVKRLIGHPPLHRGCDCGVEPG